MEKFKGVIQTMRNCPHCDSEMLEEFDHINRVRVLVCSKPTCLFRMYPDYPRRKGNEEVCYGCQRIFKVNQADSGILCPECKAKVEKSKKALANGNQKKSFKAPNQELPFSAPHKNKMRRAI